MAAITSPSITTLSKALAQDFSSLSFMAGEDFCWDPITATVTYDPSSYFACERILHEVAHATLEHDQFQRDIDLIAMEREAWQYAKLTLGPAYHVAIPPEIIDQDMDTYRDWLHARSACPACSSNGIETKKRQYTCVNCRHHWRVNDARICALRRYSSN